MNLLVIAHPQLNQSDLDLIENFRQKNDHLNFKMVKPHFTLVFPLAKFPPEEFIPEIEKQTLSVKPIDFTVHHASLHHDSFNDSYLNFLVPGEGYQEIEALHNRLYGGKLSAYLRTDLDYIPHITIGNSTEKKVAEQWVYEWNKTSHFMKGRILSLDIVGYRQETVTTIKNIILQGNLYRDNPDQIIK